MGSLNPLTKYSQGVMIQKEDAVIGNDNYLFNMAVVGGFLNKAIPYSVITTSVITTMINRGFSVCNQCGSRVKVIACIEHLNAISKILNL